MKKILSVVLAVVMLMSMACVAFAASNSYQVTAKANKTSVEKGEVVTVTVTLPANSNLGSFQYAVKYNPSSFTYVEGSLETKGAFAMEMDNASTAGTIKYAGITSSLVTEAKTLLTFKVVAENSGRLQFVIEEAYVGANDVDKTAEFQANSTQEIYIEVKGTEEPVTPEGPNYSVKIKSPSKTSIRNKDGIILHPASSNVVPKGAKYDWDWNNGNFKVTENSDGTVKIVAENAGNTTFTLKLVDANGKILATDSVNMYSDSGFFQKIGGFFRSLFGGTKIYAE